MANEKHLYLTLQGGYTHANLATEQWQVGVRLALVFGVVDALGTLPNNWEPTAENVAITETDWRIDGNWSVAGPTLATFSGADYLNDTVQAAADAWVGQSGISSLVRLDTINLYPIGSNGKAVPAPPYAVGTPLTLTYTGSSHPVGGAGGGICPPQVSVVASHRTSQIGRHGRGRMFIPGPATGNLVNGLIAGSGVASYLADQVTFLEALQIGGSAPLDANVRAIVTGSPWTAYACINAVDVGNVFDTQRRRRAQLVETRVSAPVSI